MPRFAFFLFIALSCFLTACDPFGQGCPDNEWRPMAGSPCVALPDLDAGPPPVDAGPNGGTDSGPAGSDAAVSDAAVSDAAAPSDAGAPDATVADAG